MKTAVNNIVYVDNSSLSGEGLFAQKLIKKGDNLFIAFARTDFSRDNAESKIFERHFSQLYPNNFVNHSLAPNSENYWAGALYIVKRATRDILPGEEILSNYQKGMELIRANGFTVNNWLKF